ncbi:transmembrane protein [Nitratireductor pacificus pht-3B]|uniref:Transmembrane protein n=2 Tax=Nitratireductor TaxID=245876 RepID=K2MBI8_9HYPH|nr:transmembrane protein [Nitratireductor pacificus pht-3B]
MKLVPAFENAKRAIMLVMGFVMLVLGVIGIFLPVMPTAVFLILAAWFFGRSSPALERRLLENPRFGGMLRNWRDHGAIPRRAKLFAVAGIAAGYVLSIIAYEPGLPMALAILAMMSAVAAWIVTRPES